VKFKLDENLAPTLAGGVLTAGHEAHSVLEQTLGDASDPRVIEVCRLENRALITLDLDLANIQRYLPALYAVIVVPAAG
jgi:predicted nuclease of predicted toxin-antitoxin system